MHLHRNAGNAGDNSAVLHTVKAVLRNQTGISQNVLFVETVQRAFIHAFGLLSTEEPFLLTNFHKAAGAGFVIQLVSNFLPLLLGKIRFRF